MRNIFRATNAESITILDEQSNEVIATFTNNEVGRKAYDDFKHGLAKNRNFNLYDRDGAFIAGDLTV